MGKHLALTALACVVTFTSSARAQAPSTPRPDFPKWVDDVGARSAPKTKRTCLVAGANDGVTSATKLIQRAIDDCAKSGDGFVTFKPGTYLTGALFLKSNV